MGVFTSKENAETVKTYIESVGSYDGDGATIKEWELNPSVNEINKGYKIHTVHMLINGDTEKVIKHNSYYESGSSFYTWKRTEVPAYKDKGVPDCLVATVWARNEKHAVKIANEKRAQMIASGEWK